MPEWLNGIDLKSIGEDLRRFESCHLYRKSGGVAEAHTFPSGGNIGDGIQSKMFLGRVNVGSNPTWISEFLFKFNISKT